MLEMLGVKALYDADDFVKLASRLGINLFFAFVVVRGIHYRLFRNRELAFTYLLFNVITFSLCFLLRKVPIELGFALGLFAVFGVLRYRTEPIRTRDLTYLFIVIGLAILNALANEKVSLVELLFLDVTIVGLTWMMACSLLGQRERVFRIVYDNLELLKPGQRDALKADLTARIGLDVLWIEIGDVSLLQDTADLTVTCRKPKCSTHAC